mmetsp:Transcript_13303/g.18770  ORF Transcript_13303/g.18770 Transcript_13303/m.18770 type:complete len:201 (+) Transcript_13303:54-656(+)
MVKKLRQSTRKERSQPLKRKKLGLLEKHKDYVIRAKNFNQKRDKIQKFQQKAAMKNLDEFYFGMNSAKVKDGIHEYNEETTLDDDTKLVLKTQDLTYLNMKSAVDAKKVERLQKNLHLLGSKPVNKHTIFLETQKDKNDFDVAKHFGTVPELAERCFNRPRIKTLQQNSELGNISKSDLKKVEKYTRSSYKELKEREKKG